MAACPPVTPLPGQQRHPRYVPQTSMGERGKHRGKLETRGTTAPQAACRVTVGRRLCCGPRVPPVFCVAAVVALCYSQTSRLFPHDTSVAPKVPGILLRGLSATPHRRIPSGPGQKLPLSPDASRHQRVELCPAFVTGEQAPRRGTFRARVRRRPHVGLAVPWSVVWTPMRHRRWYPLCPLGLPRGSSGPELVVCAGSRSPPFGCRSHRWPLSGFSENGQDPACVVDHQRNVWKR